MIEIKVKKKLRFSDGGGILEVDEKIGGSDFLVLYGPSGAGKTTILRMLSGLVSPDEGKIIVDGKTWFDKNEKINLPPQKRSIGFVFQDYALFPNMTVKENLLYAQESRDDHLLSEIIGLLSLDGLDNRRPEDLSGGQKQRVAVARAIIRRPQILLLDEPLSALDNATRLDLQNILAEIHRRLGLTSVMVSHELSEIARLGKKVWILEKGKVIEKGDPFSVFSKGKVSGKVKIVGEIINIQKEDIVFVVTVVTGNNFVKVIAAEDDIMSLSIGDKVLIASKAFNPIIMKI